MANLAYFIDMDKEYLLDGHFCLLTENGTIERVPLDVFETINPDMILLIEGKPTIICQRLLQRDSVLYSIELLSSFLQEERNYAKEVAESLGIPIKICNSEIWTSCIDEVVGYLNQ